MVFAGYDSDGFPIGIGRFCVEKDTLPGTLFTKEGYVKVCFACKSHTNYEQFEILCDGNIDWVESEGGAVLDQSVEGGKSNGYYYDRLLVGKVEHKGQLVVGKVHPSHNCLYIPWGEAELKWSEKYLHLIDKNIPKRTERQGMPYFDQYPADESGSETEDGEEVLEPVAMP